MKVLLIDDNPGHRELVGTRLARALPGAEIVQILRQRDLDVQLAARDFDLVLTDYRLNWTDGLQLLQEVKRVRPDVPVVMVTETGSEEIAAEGMKAGLSDYILKGQLHRLPLALNEALEKAQLRREHEAALERLLASEERYRVVSEVSTDYAYSLRLEPDGRIEREWLTQAFQRITGYREEELGSGVLLPVAHPEDRALVKEGRKRLARGEPYTCQVRIITRSGEVRWLADNARPVWDAAHERVVRVIGAGQDVTERRRMEDERSLRIREQAAAEASERRHRLLAEAIPQIVWTARPDGSLDYMNRRWFEFTGLSEAETYAPGGWKNALHPDDVELMDRLWREALTSGNEYAAEFRLRRASDGTYRCQLARALPVRDPAGGIVNWFGTCTDIEDQKRSQEQLREAQKLESIGLLAGGIAHDFNNLLTGVIGNTSLALDLLSNDSQVRALIENAMLASERAADLTRQLLAYSGKGRFYVQPVNLSGLVREISTLIRTSIPKKVELRLELDETLPTVEADATQIQQLVMNLVINGAEAIGEKRGSVVVVTGTRQIAEADHLKEQGFAQNGIPPGQYVFLEVRDDGCGMDEATRARVFDPFFTTKFTGRGLGMSAVLGIVRGHHGAIRVTSAPGKGSSFLVLLPAMRTAEPPADGNGKRPGIERWRGSGTVLVVDDEDIVRRAAKSVLERFGYTVLLADNGEEALDVIERQPGICLVLLDMTMPVLGGDETLAEIKRRRPELPVIASSGYTEAVALQRFTGGDLAGFIQKPYTAPQVLEAVSKALDPSRGAPALK